MEGAAFRLAYPAPVKMGNRDSSFDLSGEQSFKNKTALGGAADGRPYFNLERTMLIAAVEMIVAGTSLDTNRRGRTWENFIMLEPEWIIHLRWSMDSCMN